MTSYGEISIENYERVMGISRPRPRKLGRLLALLIPLTFCAGVFVPTPIKNTKRWSFSSSIDATKDTTLAARRAGVRTLAAHLQDGLDALRDLAVRDDKSAEDAAWQLRHVVRRGVVRIKFLQRPPGPLTHIHKQSLEVIQAELR